MTVGDAHILLSEQTFPVTILFVVSMHALLMLKREVKIAMRRLRRRLREARAPRKRVIALLAFVLSLLPPAGPAAYYPTEAAHRLTQTGAH